ncbi:glucose-1-phosphate thymidylyltransferase RfbA [Caulobacter sp. KR2-114]|uniref:glucose-1-phosphate thymidylyltransferase RfbA n=1 Tax=Caulobacter sp. KR2-114 TaxID=3400912 RepID=UPI003C1165D7
MTRRGMILAGGAGTRLYPLTQAVSKQLLPVYNKPMIFYPLSVLMLAGVREILVITTPEDQPQFRRLLGDGGQYGLSIDYVVQPRPEGLPQAYVLGEDFLRGEPSVLVLGDNIFYGGGFSPLLRQADAYRQGATVFGYPVADPARYGVVEFDSDGRVISLEEKPAAPKSNVAVTGLYFFDGRASRLARDLRPSARGELEIVDLIGRYLDEDALKVVNLGRGFAWLDTGTHDALIQAGEFVRTIEERQGLRIGCLEEIAFQNGWIDRAQLRELAARAGPYGAYLSALAEGAVS